MVHGSSGWSDHCVMLPCYLWAACVHVAFMVQKAQGHSHKAFFLGTSQQGQGLEAS